MVQRFNLTFRNVREFDYSHGELSFFIDSAQGYDDVNQTEINVGFQAALYELQRHCPQLIEISKL